MDRLICICLLVFACRLVSVAQCPSSQIIIPENTYCFSDLIPLEVTNAPANSIISWNTNGFWDTSSTTHLYSPSSVGFQNISVRYTLANGTLCQVDSLNLIEIKDLPTPSYSVSETKLCNGAEPVTFTDETPDSEKRTWVINGKRFNIKSKSWSLPIDKVGGTNVTLIVQDSFGCRSSRTWNNVVQMYDDIELDFTKSNEDNCIPVSVNFTSTYTTGQQTINSYIWDIPNSNKTNPTSANVSGINYNSIGNNRVALTVLTNRGCSYTKTKNNFITVGDTIKMSVSASKSNLCLSEPVTITQHRNPVPGRFIWDIGSASKEFPTKYQGIFTFRDTGSFDLNLSYNHNNCISKLTSNKIVKVGGQKAIFTSPDNFHCETPHTVTLENESDTISGGISGYYWEITDSKTDAVVHTSTQKEINYTVSKVTGVNEYLYDVMLVTTAAGTGCKDTAREEEYIRILPYQFDFFARPTSVCVDEEVKYYNRTKSASYYGLDLFSWDFLNQDKSQILASSAASVASMTYDKEGYFHATLTAANPLGCQQLGTLDSVVEVVNPDLSIFPEDSVICAVDFLQYKGTPTPTNPVYNHTYIFRHKATGNTTTYDGDSVLVSLPEIGDYEMLYHYGNDEACNDTLKKNVYANGIKGRIEVDSASGCAPLTVRPRFIIEDNSHVGNPDTSLQYNWSVSPSAGAVLQGASSPNPILTLNQDRAYRVSLYVTNSTGCSYTVTSDYIRIGVRGELDANVETTCLGDTIVLTNITLNNPNINIWSVETPKPYDWYEKDSLTRVFTAKDTGSYIIKLIVSKDAICTDTTYKEIRVASPQANFSLLNSQLSCAPFDAVFENKSIDADSIFWNFGDGNVFAQSTADTTFYTYLNNSDAAGFDVQLIAKNNFGCYDTTSQLGLIKLSGPIAGFDIIDGSGCEPNQVTFVNTSQNYDSLFFTYGNTLETDTNTIKNRIYWNDSEQITKRETPVLLIKDKNGCEASHSITNGVVTNNIPEINLEIENQDLYCQRQDFLLSDTGKYATRWKWTLNDSVVSYSRKDTTKLVFDGINTIKLIASNSLNCADTAEVSVNAASTSEITFDHPEVICKDQSFDIIASISLSSTPTEFRWNMGEPNSIGNIQTNIVNSASMSYRFPGIKTINLAIDLDNGCTIIDSTDINCFDSDKIRVVELQYAQYTDDNDIETVFSNINLPYFEHLNFYRNNNLEKIETEHPINRVLDQTFSPDERNCYNVSITDICGVEGERGRAHCPVNLNASLNGDRKVSLDWTYYVGWDRVDGYAIHRLHPDSTDYLVIDTVFSTKKSFIDSFNVCDVDYKYKVLALKANSTITSQSNTITISPTIDENTSVLLFDNISVPDNDHIELRWSPSQYRYNNGYLLTKHPNSKDNITDSIWVADSILSYVDNDALTPEKFHYFYKLHQVDNCNKVSKTSEFVKTILLTGGNEDATSNIFWTAYEDWDYPIIEHHVEHLGISTRNYLQKVDAHTFTFSDNNFYEDIDGYYYYQVHTVNSNGDTSYSNIAYITGDGKIYKPNSFTPNGDGLNDVFKFTTLFITNAITDSNVDFELAIYNRWGQKVFETNDKNEGWNGVYQGKIVPQGVYQYRAKFTDGKERQTYDSGVIHVVY